MKPRNIAILLIVFSMPLYARKKIDVSWDQLCQGTAFHEIGIKTVTGETVYGYCVKVDADTVMTNDDNDRRFTVKRSDVTRILMYPTRHYLRTWAEAVGGYLDFGFNSISGLILVPATLVVGAVALPYCAVVDLRAVLIGATELRVK